MQAILLFLLIGLGFSESSAQDFKIGRGSNGELVLSGSNCETLLRQQNALCNWKKELVPEFTPTLAACQRTQSGKYSLSIGSCLPDLTRKIHQKKLYRHGPNCWGTAMNFRGLSKKPRFFWPEELQYWMESPLCRKLDVNEAMKPGDIINVYYPEYQDGPETSDPGIEFWKSLYPNRYSPLPSGLQGYTGYHGLLHSVTYLSPELAFGKDSPSKDDVFYFHPLNEVYGRSRDSECRENQSMSPHLRQYGSKQKDVRDSKCGYLSIAYRCDSIEGYLQRSGLSSQNELRWKSIQKLQAFQEKLFPLIVTLKYVVDPKELKEMVTIARTISAEDRELLKQPTDSTSEMLLTLEYFTAAGILQSLEFAGIKY